MASPGKLDQRITFERFAKVSNGMGGSTKVWTALPSNATVWARVKAGAGAENFEEDRVNARSSKTFTIRNRNDISELDRIVWLGSNYNIRRIDRMGLRKKYLDIVAERGVAS